jgi:cellulose synthase/poly-beta-1,6-N-acetylglucosamine synthase-like glycosyltransferase
LWALGGLLWLLWALFTAYLLVLALAAAFYRPRPIAGSGEWRRFCILMPAHDEELVLGDILERLGAVEYPADRFEVVVVADNCTDRTAAIARAGGAVVLERSDPVRRGKGYALQWGLGWLLEADPRYDAFVVMDADSVLSPRFLQAMNDRLAVGARAVQARYDVLNARDSWRTRLMACALALAHDVRPKGRSRLGLSDGLKGNGMCFSRDVVAQHPWPGESITEDIDFTLRLVEAGIRVEYAPEATVWAQMPVSARQSASQRERWEGGRYALMRRALGLLGRSVRRRNAMQADRAIELIVPPFAELFAVPWLMLGLGLGAAWVSGGSVYAHAWLLGWTGVLAAQVAYLAIGLAVARVPLDLAAALLFAPVYIPWKLWLYAGMVARRGVGGWNRTERTTLTR